MASPRQTGFVIHASVLASPAHGPDGPDGPHGSPCKVGLFGLALENGPARFGPDVVVLAEVGDLVGPDAASGQPLWRLKLGTGQARGGLCANATGLVVAHGRDLRCFEPGWSLPARVRAVRAGLGEAAKQDRRATPRSDNGPNLGAPLVDAHLAGPRRAKNRGCACSTCESQGGDDAAG